MSRKTSPLALYKANAALQWRLTRLLQENSHRWLQSLQQTSAGGMAKTTHEIEQTLNSANWQAMTTLPADSLRRMLQMCASDAETIQQAAWQNQAAFIAGLQQALQTWQKETLAAMAGASALAAPQTPGTPQTPDTPPFAPDNG